jgi:hypothetical protein
MGELVSKQRPGVKILVFVYRVGSLQK